MSRKVLIIGGKGTLGQALVREFVDFGDEVTSWDREDIDVTADEAAQKIIDAKPNVIINATGYNAVDKAEADNKEKQLAYDLNAEAPKKIAEAAKSINAVFVNYSTDFVFDGVKGNYAEDDLPNPQSVYGQSKYLGEKNIAEVGGRYYIIRPSRIFGNRGLSETSKKIFVDMMMEKAGLPEIKVVSDEFGSPTYAPDLAKFTKMLIDENYPSGIYHGTNAGSASWYEWAEEIFRLIGKTPKLIPISSKEFNNPAPRPANSSLIQTKTPLQRSWREALKEFLK